jgi:general stress protein CsbA
MFLRSFLLFAASYNSSFYVVAISVVSLANALVRVASLEAKLKATS